MQLAAVFGEISSTAFGGAQTARIRHAVIVERGWLTEEEFLEILSLAEVVPGSNPVDLAVLIGLRTSGLIGAAVAMLACMLPGFLILLAVAWILAANPHNRPLHGAIFGCAAAAAGLTVGNTLQMTVPFRRRWLELGFVAVTFGAVVFLHASLEFVLLVFTPLAIALRRLMPRHG